MSPTIFAGLLAFFLFTGTAGQASAPDFPSLSVTLTAYNAVPGQTDADPFITASGSYANPSVVVARSRDLAKELPFGTVIAIEPPADPSHTCGYDLVGGTIGYRVVADTMNARFTKYIDVLLPVDEVVSLGGKSVSLARALGTCKDVTIRVVGKIDITKPSNLPKTQAALAAKVGASGLAVK